MAVSSANEIQSKDPNFRQKIPFELDIYFIMEDAEPVSLTLFDPNENEIKTWLDKK